jgi:hypothetical protein
MAVPADWVQATEQEEDKEDYLYLAQLPLQAAAAAAGMRLFHQMKEQVEAGDLAAVAA